MKRVNEYLVMVALALATLSGCEEDVLSFGVPRCRDVSCAPHELEPKSELSPGGAATYTRREGVVEVSTLPVPCPIEGRCGHTSSPAMRLLTRADEISALAAAPFFGFHGEPEKVWRGGTGVWLGRYQDGAWQSSSFIRTDGPLTNPQETRVAIASDNEAGGEALVAVSEVRNALDDAERRLRVFRFDEHDELQLLFEDLQAASLRDAVMIERDVLVAGLVQGNCELTRYAPDGKILWRQTTLRASNGFPGDSSEQDMHLGVFDRDRIAVLLSSGPSGGLNELLVLDGSGEKLWSYPTQIASDLGARLAVDSSGGLLVATGGYAIERIEIGDGVERWHGIGRARDEYFELEIGGFDVGPSGWAYFGTRDGDFSAPVDLLERSDPGGNVVESIEVKTEEEPSSASLSDLTPDSGGCGGVFGDYGTLRIDPSEQRAFVATSLCIAEIPLPPLPE